MSGSYFFTTFPGFDHDPNARVSKEFARLAKYRGWKPGSKNWNKNWKQCIGDEYDNKIGRRVNSLETWQALCTKLGIKGNLNSITKCRKALKRVNVNIVDLLECWETSESPRQFLTVADLADYSVRTEKVFNRNIAKQDKVLKVLLRRLF